MISAQSEVQWDPLTEYILKIAPTNLVIEAFLIRHDD